jgi:hypothetical protein
MRCKLFNQFLIGLLLSTSIPVSTAFSSRSIHSPSALYTVSKPLRKKALCEAVILYTTPQNNLSQPGDENSEDTDTEQRRPRPLVRFIDNLFYVMSTPFPDLRKLARKRDNNSKFVISLRLEDGLAALMAYLGVGVFSYHYIFEKWSIIDSLYFTCVCFSTVG